MMRLEVTSPSISSLPLSSSVPIGQRGLVHIWGRNDTSETQRMGISWVVKDPTGSIVEEYSAWEFWPYTGPGVEHEFIGDRFDLHKGGTYTLEVNLLMNPDNPIVVDSYDGDLCMVTTDEVPPPPPEEEKKFPWVPVIIGAGAVIATIGLAAAAKRR